MKNVADIFKWQGKNIDKQNEAFLWRFLIVIVFAIVLLNLYLRQRLKINKAGRRKRILQFDFSGGR